MGEGERRAYHDLMSEYADAKREAREAHALVRELVEAGEALCAAHWQTWCGDPHTTPAQLAEDEAHFATFDEVKRWGAALTRAREAGYGD